MSNREEVKRRGLFELFRNPPRNMVYIHTEIQMFSFFLAGNERLH
jgi:hypothetical protein